MPSGNRFPASCAGKSKQLVFKARCLCVFICLLLFCPAAVSAAHPGFRTVGIWSEEDKIRLDLCVWYPVRIPPTVARYGGWLLKVNRRAAPLEGSFPLVIISHDSPGNRFAHHNLAASLAEKGFIVAAPTHLEDNAQNMQHLYTARQLLRRLEEIRHTIDKICADPEIGPLIDPNRIGLLGFGSGGTAALLSIGGSLSQAAWEQWKTGAPPEAPYLYPWARARLDTLAANSALYNLQADNRIRCAIAAAPAYSMLFDAASLARVRVPVMLLAAEQDPVNPPPRHLEALRDKLPISPHMTVIRGADPVSLMARPEGRTAEVLPGYIEPGVKQRQQIFEQLNNEVSAFFLRTIGGPGFP